jgi:hypothetical protein
MRHFWRMAGVTCLLLARPAGAQVFTGADELLASDRPEAWAMNYVGAATLMTAFGETPVLAPGQWSGALDVGSIPSLSDEQQRVGFRGSKQEDLNKSPVFGRARVAIGLPHGWVAEAGWTPPLSVNGIRTRDLIAIALGRNLFATDSFSLSARIFGQHGDAEGDLTCPAEVAGVTDPEVNPAGCMAPSRDRIALRHYGADMTAAWGTAPWHGHATFGMVRMEPFVRVDALLIGSVRDRSRLVARDVLPYVAAGGGRDLGDRWRLSFEVLYVPLSVRRDPEGASSNDPLTSFRAQLRYDGP